MKRGRKKEYEGAPKTYTNAWDGHSQSGDLDVTKVKAKVSFFDSQLRFLLSVTRPSAKQRARLIRFLESWATKELNKDIAHEHHRLTRALLKEACRVLQPEALSHPGIIALLSDLEAKAARTEAWLGQRREEKATWVPDLTEGLCVLMDSAGSIFSGFTEKQLGYKSIHSRAAKVAIEELAEPSRFGRILSSLSREGIEIQGYVGGGGWGVVFAAFNKITDQPSAIKFFKRPYRDEWVRRFEREALILQKLRGKRGIPQIFGTLSEVEGIRYLEMEYIRGTPLAKLRLPLDTHRACAIISEILGVLSVVHQEHILHRDLHLGNVVQSDTGLILLDFGAGRDEDIPSYPPTFRPIGAMSTCAPEKWRDPSAAGPASDVFSVGGIFYKLLTGKNPFWADSYIRLYEKISRGDYDPPSKIVPGVPAAIEQVIGIMLAPDPQKRFSSAEAALARLRQV